MEESPDGELTNNDQIWPPAPTGQAAYEPHIPARSLNWRILILAAGGGLFGGIVDVFRTDTFAVYLFAGIAAVVGFLQPKPAILSAVVIALCYYLCHVTAIMVGVKPPYVEYDAIDALNCLIIFFPTCTSAACGALARVIWNFGAEKLGAPRK